MGVLRCGLRSAQKRPCLDCFVHIPRDFTLFKRNCYVALQHTFQIYRVLRQHNRNPTLTQQSHIASASASASAPNGTASRSLLRRQHSGGSTSSLIDESRRHQEDALALLFINIILVFIVCHLPRVVLNLYEMFVIDRASHCFALGLSAYGMWAHIVVCIR